jgi:two-component system, NtrC family, response regulator HydG
MKNASVLLVDDEPNATRVLSAILRADNYSVLEAMCVDSALNLIRRKPVDAIITDIKMPGKDGYQLFDYVNKFYPHIPVMFLTAYGKIDSAVAALSKGAYYYFVKPPDYQKLKQILLSAINQSKQSANPQLPDVDALPESKSDAMMRVYKTISAIKDKETSVLLTGETGTGKEVIAKYLHYHSVRRDRPFVAVNCAAIPRDLLESELFGYEKGSFTGATASRSGKFEDSAGGTLFLDEIGEMDAALQAKLLRVLQERQVQRLGSSRKIDVDFRLITSTNRDLLREMETGRFRGDLFYRINVVCLHLPPLRERREDIPMLAMHFLNDFCKRESRHMLFANEIFNVLAAYPWPGNIRQLKNAIERTVVMSPGPRISPNHLPDEIRTHSSDNKREANVETLRSLELNAILDTLNACNGNKSEAARKLGISRKALYSRLKSS